jgi:hypothetical protein
MYTFSRWNKFMVYYHSIVYNFLFLNRQTVYIITHYRRLLILVFFLFIIKSILNIDYA